MTWLFAFAAGSVLVPTLICRALMVRSDENNSRTIARHLQQRRHERTYGDHAAVLEIFAPFHSTGDTL